MTSPKLSLILAAAAFSLAGCVYDYPPVAYVPAGPYDYRYSDPALRYREPQRPPYVYGPNRPAVPSYEDGRYGYRNPNYRPNPNPNQQLGWDPNVPPYYPDDRQPGLRNYAPPTDQRTIPQADIDAQDTDRNPPPRTNPPPTRQDAPSASSGDHPTATKTGKPGRVKVPFPPYRELDVSGMASGSLARDPTTGKIFRVP